MVLTAQLSSLALTLEERARTDRAVKDKPSDQVKPASPSVTSLRQHQRRLQAGEILELVAAYMAGATVRDLTQQFGIHRTTVLEHLKRNGVSRRPHQRKLTELDVQAAVRLYRAGWSTTRLGRRFRVDAETVRRELHRAGMTLQPARGRER